MALRILRIGIMDIIGSDERYVKFTAKPHESRIYHFLIRQTVILQFQEIIPLPEAVKILKRRLLSLIVQIPLKETLHLARDAGRTADYALMVFPKHLDIHTGLVVISFRKSLAHYFAQVLITLVVLRQKYQMVEPLILFITSRFLVKAAVRGNIYLAAYDRLYARIFGCPVKIDRTVHISVIGYRGRVHAKFLDS